MSGSVTQCPECGANMYAPRSGPPLVPLDAKEVDDQKGQFGWLMSILAPLYVRKHGKGSWEAAYTPPPPFKGTAPSMYERMVGVYEFFDSLARFGQPASQVPSTSEGFLELWFQERYLTSGIYGKGPLHESRLLHRRLTELEEAQKP